MYDSWQMGNVLELGCGSPTPERTCSAPALAAFYAYGRDMNATIHGVMAARRATGRSSGTFLSACIVHCQTIYNEGEDRWPTWKIQGTEPRAAFANFYFGRPGPTVLVDPNPYPANPSCPVWTAYPHVHTEDVHLQPNIDDHTLLVDVDVAQPPPQHQPARS